MDVVEKKLDKVRNFAGKPIGYLQMCLWSSNLGITT